jgi:hypothetical protein
MLMATDAGLPKRDRPSKRKLKLRLPFCTWKKKLLVPALSRRLTGITQKKSVYVGDLEKADRREKNC